MSRNRKRHVCECCANVFSCDGPDLPKHRVVYDGMNFTVCSFNCAAKILKAHWHPERFKATDLLVASYPGRRLLS